MRSSNGGQTVPDNLALACPHCNRYKGPNIAGLDPVSEELVRLFHPRNDQWAEHFAWDGPRLIGETSIGRATVQLLDMNSDGPLRLRTELLGLAEIG